MNYSELLQLAKGWGNFVSNRINIWRLRFIGLKCLKGDPIIKAENAKSLGVEGKIWQRFIILKMMKISPE